MFSKKSNAKGSASSEKAQDPAYYKWKNREESIFEAENKMLIAGIIALYEEFDGIYGYRR